jgi:hypothetical protein
MRRIVFYSWQSDLPNSENRGFIYDALKVAANKIIADNTIDVEPVIDRDTKGVSGTPDIASTIFSKISASDVFVADISIINKKNGGRPTPNPNVLIELGYAIKTVGYERMILVFNEAYGKIEDLPFDLRSRRVATYNFTKNRGNGKEKTELQNKLKEAIVSALKNIPDEENNSTLIQSVDAIESEKTNKIIPLRRDLKEIFEKIVAIEPKKFRDEGTTEELITSINGTSEIVIKFSKIAEIIAVMQDKDCALEVCRWFGNILEKYDLPYGFSGTHYNSDEDYYKFIGHELFTTFIAFLLKEQRWEIIKAILEEPIPIKYLRNSSSPGHTSWHFLSDFLPSLEDESRKKSRISVHSDMLHARHAEGLISEILPFEDFIAADFLLFLASKFLLKKEDYIGYWYPRSIVHIKHTPMFIKNAERKSVADNIAKVFKVPNGAEGLRAKMIEIHPEFDGLVSRGFWHNPINKLEISKIGTI